MRGQDLTKKLDEKEVRRLRTLLADNPQYAETPETGGEYPRMLYHPDYLEAQITFRKNIDPLVKKQEMEKMKMLARAVFDLEDEEDLLAEGWKHSPADHLPTELDPRIPRGRDAKRAVEANRKSVAEEVRALRRRLAELESTDEGREELDQTPIAARPAGPVGGKTNLKGRKGRHAPDSEGASA